MILRSLLLIKLELLIKYPGIIFVFWVMSTQLTV